MDDELDELLNSSDDDLLSMIERWSQERSPAPQEPQAPAPPLENPWHIVTPQPGAKQGPSAVDIAAAAFWSAEEEQAEGLPPLEPRKAKEAQAAKKRKPIKKMKKKKRRIRRFFAWLLAIILLLSGLLAGGAAWAAGSMQHAPLDSAKKSAIRGASTGNPFVTNILVMGVDAKRIKGARADSMLLLSIDRLHGQLKVTSILRDSWVKFPNGSYNKINAATSLGGGALAMQVVSENFGVRVDHYVTINFTGFEKAIDALGGISVPITDKEITYLCNNTRLGKQIGKAEMTRQMERSNKVKLTGEQALIFCRIRKGDSDFKRTDRQRIMLTAMLKACLTKPYKLFEVVQQAMPECETSLSPLDTAAITLGAPLCLLRAPAEHTLPAEGSWNYAKKNGASVISLDIAKNAAALKGFIYE